MIRLSGDALPIKRMVSPQDVGEYLLRLKSNIL